MSPGHYIVKKLLACVCLRAELDKYSRMFCALSVD